LEAKVKKNFLRILMQAIITTILVMTTFSTISVGYAFCHPETSIEAKIMEHEYARGHLTPAERNYLANHPELAEMRAKKDAEYLLNIADKRMNASMNDSVALDVAGTNSTTIYLGRDATIYSCHTGNNGGSRSGLADWPAHYSASGKWSDISTTAVGWGDASAWSWVGPQAYVSGARCVSVLCLSRGKCRAPSICFRGSRLSPMGLCYF
jgi:hypothetical protein